MVSDRSHNHEFAFSTRFVLDSPVLRKEFNTPKKTIRLKACHTFAVRGKSKVVQMLGREQQRALILAAGLERRPD